MTATVTIRRAETRDLDAIWALLKPVFRAGDTYAIDPGISREVALEHWTREHAYVAEHGAILGTYYIRRNQDGGGMHVCNAGYVTARAAQGKGVARAMLAHSLETAKGLGFEAMQYNFVLATNTRAIDTWLRAGFAEIGRIPRAFRLPDGGHSDALILHRFL